MERDYEEHLAYFEDYFLRRAAIADALCTPDFVSSSRILSTTALDALAEIWLYDFPEEAERLCSRYSKKKKKDIPPSLRFSQLLKKFAPNDPDANKVAVVCFAQDWKKFRPQDAELANLLLEKRVSQDSHARPSSRHDLSLEELDKEIAPNVELRRVAEEYEYGAIVYRFYRCALVHYSQSSNWTHGFVRGEGVSYQPSWLYDPNCPERYLIGFEPNLITRWLRTVTKSYVYQCREQSKRPAEDLISAQKAEKAVKELWEKW